MNAAKQGVADFLLGIEPLMRENQERLDALDAVAGDGDHGATMVMGWGQVTAAVTAADPSEKAGGLLRRAGGAFADVGGSIGPLWGTALLRAGREVGDFEELDLETVIRAVTAGTHGIAERGRSEEGDKTLLDVLVPASRAFASTGAEGGSAEAALLAGHASARTGLIKTAGMSARRGRARRLSARSQGHQDPGAASAYLIWRLAAELFSGVDLIEDDPIVYELG
jgi:dihydroxyacetone kinase phosphoprotein-dependent L subunit